MGEAEVAIAVRALAEKSASTVADATDERNERQSTSGTVSPRPVYLAAAGGVLGIVVLVALVTSVLTVSDDSRHPVVEMKPATPTQASSVPPSPSVPVAELPATPNQPTPQAIAPQPPLTAETLRPEPLRPPAEQMFPRWHRWFPRFFRDG